MDAALSMTTLIGGLRDPDAEDYEDDEDDFLP